MASEAQIGCCVFLSRHSSLRRLTGYRALPECDDESTTVTVVAGKERREFAVDPCVLEKEPFRVLMEMVCLDRKEKKRKRKDVIFVDVDAILFEHMLWLVYNESPSSASLLQLNLKEIIEFYSQDC